MCKENCKSGSTACMQMANHTKEIVLVLIAILVAIATTKEREQWNSGLPIKVSFQEIQSDSDESCPTNEQRQSNRAAAEDKLRSIIRESILTSICEPGGEPEFPAQSCNDIPLKCSSGWYWLQPPSSETVVRVYCDLNRTICSCNSIEQQRGWMRVGYLDMRDPSQQCPEGLRLIREPKRACRRSRDSFRVAVIYPTYGMNYTRVCGKIIGYQLGRPEAFATYVRNPALTLDSRYVDGVSITYGPPPNRKHIWTFATSPYETYSGTYTCPCMNPNDPIVSNITIPSFINNDYFCASSQERSARDGVLYTDDPLWDGQGCGEISTCCSFNNPPWFCKTLPRTTNEDIEVRLLTATGYSYLEGEDTPIEQIEIYIQ